MAPLLIPKTSLQLYRDCLRLIRHIAPPGAGSGSNPKYVALHHEVKKQFVRNRSVTNQEDIERLQSQAVRALSNYMLQSSAIANKDPAVANAMNDYNRRSTPSS